VFDYWRAERHTLAQGGVANLISSGGDLLVGLALAFMSNRLIKLPGLFVLIPAAIGMRGNVFGALGSRLGTGMHAGLFQVSRDRRGFLSQNAFAAAVLTVATSLFLAIAARAASAVLGQPHSISVWDFFAISILGGVIGSIVVGTATVFISVLANRRGWDLDSVSAPLVTAMGDTCTLPALWAASYLVVPPGPHGNHVVTLVVGTVAAGASLYFVVRGFFTDLPIARRIIRESMVVLFIAGLIDILAGTAIQARAETFFVKLPALLVLLPAFLEDTGAIGGILSARLSSKLHLGVIEPRAYPEPVAALDASLSFVFAASVYTLVALSAQLISVATHNSGPGVVGMLAISLFAGFLATIISSAIAYYGAVATYRFGLDPDNHGIPLLTSLMDLAGTLCLILGTVLFTEILHV